MRASELTSPRQAAVRSAVQAKRGEMELKFLRARMQRCERGVPISAAWVAGWQDFIQQQVRAAASQALQQHSARAQQQAGYSSGNSRAR